MHKNKSPVTSRIKKIVPITRRIVPATLTVASAACAARGADAGFGRFAIGNGHLPENTCKRGKQRVKDPIKVQRIKTVK